MSEYRPFAMLSAIEEQSYFTKALYYAFGRNDSDDLVSVDAVKFAELYSEHASTGGSIISVQDCFDMFGNGETEFRR